MVSWPYQITQYQRYLKLEKGLAYATLENYSRDVLKLADFFNQTIDFKNVTKFQIQEFIYSIAKKNSKRTQSRVISSLKSFFSYLCLEEIRPDNPAELLESPRLDFLLPDILNLEEIDLLLQAIDLSKPLGKRNHTILEVLYGCGLRVSELIQLKISDFYFPDEFVSVIGKGDKQRLIPLGQHTASCVKDFISGARNQIKINEKSQHLLFLNRRGKQLTRVMIFTIIKDLAKKADLTKTVSPHSFRHSYATHLLQNGANLRAIQQMLGHENIVTTEIYTHIENQQLKEAILKFHPRNKK